MGMSGQLLTIPRCVHEDCNECNNVGSIEQPLSVYFNISSGIIRRPTFNRNSPGDIASDGAHNRRLSTISPFSYWQSCFLPAVGHSVSTK